MALRKGAGVLPAPWEDAEPHEQLFVLITGANSGLGLATCQRLIDEFLATRSLNSHLILLPTTRSKTKSLETIHTLRAYAENAARTSKTLQSRAGESGDDDYDWEEHAERIHVLSVQLDLCDIRGIYEVADTLCQGELSNPPGVEGPDAQLKNIKLPRLDTVICNAAYGGWSGVNYFWAIYAFLFQGFTAAVTTPKFKIALPDRILNETPSYQYPAKPLLGEVFAAGVFGHYLLAHQLLPLLRRPKITSDDDDDDDTPPPGRIIWTSSVEAVSSALNPTDIQALDPTNPSYESSKRLTDVLALSATLPSVRPIAAGAYLRYGDDADETTDPPRIYLSQPGVVVSTLFPLPWFFFWAYELALMLARWLGSPWHTVDAYSGSIATAWLTLQDQDELDELDAERVKWGSAADRQKDQLYVKKTEVCGWGWQGKVEGADEEHDEEDDEPTTDILHKSRGRFNHSKDVTQEDLVEFEELGRDCWEQMEEMREEWEELLDL